MAVSPQRSGSDPILSRISPAFWTIPFDPTRYPGSPISSSLVEGANCQRFAYAVLGLFGLIVPPFRSSDLWMDRTVTVRVDEPRALDLVLFGGGRNGWGAHVGVCIGGDRVLHLCREVGLPAVWTLDDFRSREEYRHLLGFKRIQYSQGTTVGGLPGGLER